MSKIVLKGFYGFGNLGDDILMITTARLVEGIFPQAKIFVCSDARNPGYIKKLLGTSAEIITSDTSLSADWIIHGGGGVFFDFQHGTAKYSWLNRAIQTIGYSSYRKFHRIYRQLRRVREINSIFRAGLGIGVGTYTSSSRKFYVDILTLADFDFLMVRDSESLDRVKRFNFKYPVHLASDLAFLHEHWTTDATAHVQATGTRKIIGIILRDWIYDNHAHLEKMFDVAIQLSGEGKQLKFFSFDKNSDRTFIEKFSTLFSVQVWEPDRCDLSDYLREIAACNVVVSSRAHGAIISACLGIPVLCLVIEPKLGQIAAMLAKSSLFITPESPEVILASIGELIKNEQVLREYTKLDVRHNREVMMEGLAIFREIIGQQSKASSCEK